jgi:N-methylhydantoinase A
MSCGCRSPPSTVDKASLEKIAESFHARHRKTYGHQNRDEPVQLVNVRIAAIGAIPALLVRNRTSPQGTNPVKSERQIWFRETGAIRATIYDRRLMPSGLTVSGPAVIESLDSTILVPPDWQAKINQDGFILLQRIRRN